MVVQFRRMWGGAKAAQRLVTGGWTDFLFFAGIFGLLYGIYLMAGQWHGNGTLLPVNKIDLSPWMLPWYTFESLMRGIFGYILSLIFTLVFGYWAAKDVRAERILVPIFDILQSIPVLGFMPFLVLGLIAMFPHSNVGLELAVVVMIFTGQVWNMTFSFYRSIQTVPREQQESAKIFGFSWWQYFRSVELPSSTMGLMWNSMMSMAGGWFFLVVTEANKVGPLEYQLSGLGSYMSVASKAHDIPAQIYAMIAMIAMVVALDQFLWRPLVAWAQKFRNEEGSSSEITTSWFLEWLRHSHLRQIFEQMSVPFLALRRLRRNRPQPPARTSALSITAHTSTGTRMREYLEVRLTRAYRWFMRAMPRSAAYASGSASAAVCASGTAVSPPATRVSLVSALSLLCIIAMVGLMAWGAWALAALLLQVSVKDWGTIAIASGLTFLRVIIATLLATLWTVPVGLVIGLSPKYSRICQPIIQIAASFPASMLFPMALGLMSAIHITLGYGSTFLMLMGVQWYILFNVIAGAMTIPADLREATQAYGISGLQRFRILYLPAIFPYLVTGWITAMGGAWNVSIVTEYFDNGHDGITTTTGLGALISESTGNNPVLAASVVVMALMVVIVNRTVWRRLYRLSETKFSLEK